MTPLLASYPFREVLLEGVELAERQFRRIEAQTPPARMVPWDGTMNWRFTEQTTSQLLLQKLARQISGVKATDLLLSAGRPQEVGVLYRMLDEIFDDIQFVVLGLFTSEWTDLHQAYANYFWSESEGEGPPYRRKKIRAFINRALGQSNPSDGDANGLKLHSLFSDFVHARSHPIMGMVAGPPPRFDLSGIFDEAARGQFAEQQPTYAFRCLMSASFVARVCLDEPSCTTCFDEFQKFEAQHANVLFPVGKKGV